MQDAKNIPQMLKSLRKSNGYTQKFLAECLNISYQAYQAYEFGRVIPPLPNLILIAKLYDVSLDYLVGGAEL